MPHWIIHHEARGTESYHTENVGTTSVYPGIQSWCGGSSGRFQNFGSYSAMCLFQNSQLRVSWRELQQMQNQRIKTQFWSHPSFRRSNLWKLVHMGSCLQTVHPKKTYYSWSVMWDNPANISILTYCLFFLSHSFMTFTPEIILYMNIYWEQIFSWILWFLTPWLRIICLMTLSLSFLKCKIWIR